MLLRPWGKSFWVCDKWRSFWAFHFWLWNTQEVPIHRNIQKLFQSRWKRNRRISSTWQVNTEHKESSCPPSPPCHAEGSNTIVPGAGAAQRAPGCSSTMMSFYLRINSPYMEVFPRVGKWVVSSSPAAGMGWLGKTLLEHEFHLLAAVA